MATDEQTDAADNNKKRFNYKEFNKVIGIMLGIWVVLAIIAGIAIYNGEVSDTGQAGDTFGIINSLFTCLAFGALWYSIRLQKEELSDTRDEFKKQTANQLKQNENLKKQSFETTFFNLLGANRNIVVANLRYGNAQGQDAMNKFMDDFHNSKSRSSTFSQEKETYQSLISATNETFYRFMFSLDTLIGYVVVSVEQDEFPRNSTPEFYFSIIASTFPQSTKEYIKCFYRYDAFNNQVSINVLKLTDLIRF